MKFTGMDDPDAGWVYRSAEGWVMFRSGTSHGWWHLVTPSGTDAGHHYSRHEAAKVAAGRQHEFASNVTGCPFCGAGPDDDDTDDCLTRGLTEADAIRLAESREERIALLQAEVDALYDYASLHPSASV